MKKLAIGGGENGRIKSNGTQLPYELEPMDREIIKLTGKDHPNFLFLGHSQTNDEYEQNYYETMQNVYENKYDCHCQTITKKDLKKNMPKVQELLEWADIIYEGGGDTLSMINLWKETGFDQLLREAWSKGKVMCGVSAGANCWFKACSSDSLKAQLGKDAPLISFHCLSLINLYFTPHCHTKGKLETVKELLKDQPLVGVFLSNCAALEIVDDKL